MNKWVLKNGETLTYRCLQDGDQGKLRSFLKEMTECAPGLFTPHACDDETLCKVIKRSTADDDRVYIALDNKGSVAGYFFLWWYSSDFPVLGIGIAEQYQGQGLGKQMIEVLISDARSNHCKAIELTTVVTNDRAYALYQQLGFIYLGKVDNLVGDGSIVEESHMYLPIEPDVNLPPRNHVTPFA